MRRILLLFLIYALTLPFSSILAASNDVINVNIDSDLAAALDAVSDHGTIYIDGRYNIPRDFVWENHGKTITITGGVLNFSEHFGFSIGDNVRFENITLQFRDNSSLYANGFDLYIHDDVKITGDVTLYGGGKAKDVARTNMTLMGGTFFNVYGGGNGGKVLGDVNLTIGGSFNKNLSISHAHDHQVFGGGNNSKIHGNVNLRFGDNAKANYIYGGCSGKNSEIKGHINLYFSSGRAISVCGGSKDVNQNCDVYLYFTGGQVEQIFGGCEKSSMVGDVLISVTGGKVTRRIYGGCYNNYTYEGWQEVPNYVYGKILLLLGENVELTLKGGGGDNTLFAHSRQVTFPQKEDAHIAFTSEAAKTQFAKKIGPQDGTMKSILGKTKGYEKQHILTHTITGNGITQSCDCCEPATAEITVNHGIYNGQPQENVTLTVSENWLGPAPVLTYDDNIDVGTAKARLAIGNSSVIVEYIIWPPVWVCVAIGAGLLLIAGGVTAFLLIRKKGKAAT